MTGSTLRRLRSSVEAITVPVAVTLASVAAVGVIFVCIAYVSGNDTVTGVTQPVA